MQQYNLCKIKLLNVTVISTKHNTFGIKNMAYLVATVGPHLTGIITYSDKYLGSNSNF